MIDLSDIRLELDNNSILKNGLESLVRICIADSNLVFESSYLDQKLGFKIKLLLEKEILKISTNEYSVVNNDYYIPYTFYEHYCQNLNFDIKSDFERNAEFIKRIKKEFIKGGYIQGSDNLIKKIWAIAIYETSKKLNSSFLNYLNKLNKENNSKEIFNFIDSFSDSLPFIDINHDELYQILTKLFKWCESDALYNANLGRLRKGISTKTYLNESFGLSFFKYSINKNKIHNYIISSVVSGLYEKLRLTFFEQELKPLLDNEKFTASIIYGLSKVKLVNDNDATIYLQLFNKFNDKNQTYLFEITRLLVSIIDSISITNEHEIKSKCFSLLEELVCIDNPNLIYYIIRSIRYVDKFSKEKTNILVKLIEQPHFQYKKYLKQIDDSFYEINEIEYFERVLLTLAENCDLDSISNFLSYSIHEFNGKEKLKFEELVITLLVHDKPKYRRLGQDIFQEINQGSIKFKFDILSLPFIKQYKLWVSICQDYSEPKYILPSLLPLINSKSPTVSESIICKLEEFSENYRDDLIDVLKNNLDFKKKQGQRNI